VFILFRLGLRTDCRQGSREEKNKANQHGGRQVTNSIFFREPSVRGSGVCEDLCLAREKRAGELIYELSRDVCYRRGHPPLS